MSSKHVLTFEEKLKYKMNICTSGNKQLPSNLARGNKLEFDVDENDYENTEPKTYEEEKEVRAHL